MLDWIKKKIKGVTRVKDVVRLSEEDAAKMEAEEQARGLAEGRATGAEVKKRQTEKQFRRTKDINVNKFLSDRAKELKFEQFKGAFSWRKFFSQLEKRKRKFNIYSYNFAKKFGNFHDLSILKDGRIALWISNDGHIEPIITGRDMKDIFRNFSGLSYTATKGHIPINLDENYDYIHNIEELEVPNVMIDGNGKIVVSSVDSGPYIRKLAEAQSTISQILQHSSFMEKSFSELVKENKMKDLYKGLNVSKSETIEAEFKANLNEIHKIMGDHNDMMRASAAISNEKQIVETRNKIIEEAKKRMFADLEDEFPETKMKRAEKIIKRNMKWANDNLLESAKAAEKLKEIPAPIPQPIEPPSPKLLGKLKKR